MRSIAGTMEYRISGPIRIHNSHRLTVDDVNAAIRRNLKSDSMRIVIVTKNAESIRDAIVKNVPSPIIYNSPKPTEIMEEDKTIQTYRVNLKPEDITILRADQIFQ